MCCFWSDLCDVQVDDCCSDVAVTEESLDGIDIDTIFEQVCSEAVPKRMHGDIFGDICFADRLIDDVLDAPFAEHLSGCLSFKEIGLWLDFAEVFLEPVYEEVSKDDVPVFSSFGLSDMDLLALEVDIGNFKQAEFIHS